MKVKNIKKTSIILVIALLLITIIIALIYYVEKNNKEKNETAQLETTELMRDTIFYDSGNYQEVKFNFTTINNKIAYAMDYGCNQDTESTVEFRNYISDQGMAIIMNGYPHKTPKEMGCLDENEAYMATQMALWEVANRTEESTKAKLVFRVDNVTPIEGKEEICQRTVNVAKKLVEYAENKPYTAVPTMLINNADADLLEIDGDSEHELVGPYKVDFEDVDDKDINYIKATLSEAPENARIVDENGNEKAIVTKNEDVYIKIEKKTTNAHIKFTSSVERKKGKIYKGQEQDYLILDNETNNAEKELSAEITFEETLGKIKLNCVDENGNPVSSCKFELLDTTGKVYGDVTTGDDGIITFYKVPKREYILRQIETNSEYEAKESSKNVIVEAGKTAEVTFINSLTKNK